MSFSNRILVGLAAGVLVGLFLGERAAALKWAADGFVKLLQMTVLPYVTVSIISSLGKLRYEDARVLGIRTGAVLVGLWLVALLFTFLIPLTFPQVQNATLLQHDAGGAAAAVQLRRSLHPVEPVQLAGQQRGAGGRAVLGRARRGADRRRAQADPARCAQRRGDALSRATRFVVRLTPYGFFAIAATAAGTLSLEQLGRLQVYLIAYVLVALWSACGCFPVWSPP